MCTGQKKMDDMLKNGNSKSGNKNQQSQNGTLSGFFVRFLNNLQTEFEKANRLKPK